MLRCQLHNVIVITYATDVICAAGVIDATVVIVVTYWC